MELLQYLFRSQPPHVSKDPFPRPPFGDSHLVGEGYFSGSTSSQ